MKLFARTLACRSAGWLLPLLLTACFNKPHQQPVQALAPPATTTPKPATTPVELPASTTAIPDQPVATVSVEPETKSAQPARSRRPKNTQQADAQPPAANPQPAPAESPAVSAIGELSSGDPADLRKQTADSIAATEHGLTGIEHSLSPQEEKIASQIREYLKQAKTALASGDVDGAHTLTAKARVLLSELNR